jgi:hypothetical protein
VNVVDGSKVYDVDDYLGVHDPATTPRKGHGLSLGYPPVTKTVKSKAETTSKSTSKRTSKPKPTKAVKRKHSQVASENEHGNDKSDGFQPPEEDKTSLEEGIESDASVVEQPPKRSKTVKLKAETTSKSTSKQTSKPKPTKAVKRKHSQVAESKNAQPKSGKSKRQRQPLSEPILQESSSSSDKIEEVWKSAMST